MLLNDEQLMLETSNGSLPAFELLVQRWDRRMTGYFYRCVGNPDEAEDLRQELFYRLYKNRKSFNSNAKFQPWLYRIATNLVIDQVARKKKPNTEILSEENHRSFAYTNSNQENHSRGKAVMKEIGERIRETLERISGEERVVLVMRHFEQLTFREIADILGAPESTVKTRLYRALRSMREELKRVGIVGMECLETN